MALSAYAHAQHYGRTIGRRCRRRSGRLTLQRANTVTPTPALASTSRIDIGRRTGRHNGHAIPPAATPSIGAALRSAVDYQHMPAYITELGTSFCRFDAEPARLASLSKAICDSITSRYAGSLHHHQPTARHGAHDTSVGGAGPVSDDAGYC